jgi:hypothetical protein
MIHIISKTLFQEFLYCPKNIWLKLNKPELTEKFTISEFELHLMEQGNEVESIAHGLEIFENGIEVQTNGEEAVSETLRLMTSLVPTIFQATFIKDGFIIRNDALKYDPQNKCWDLYEIKATNSIHEGKKRDHIVDITFQASLLRRSNVPIGKCFHVRLNKEYVRSGELDLSALFEIEDVSSEVLEHMEEVEKQMDAALEYLNRKDEPVGGCECLYGVRRNHCTTFQYSNPQIPEYSVHDLSRIHKTKLEALIEEGVFGIGDIEDPDKYKLSDKQKNQILAHKYQKPIIDEQRICEELSALQFPLYFFDYETFPPAIPVFNGYRPYQQIPFQFSLHILREREGELEHIEYLQDKFEDPTEEVVRMLQENIKGGTVIAWYKSFETRINNEIALRHPQHTTFINNLNGSMYDLMDIFFNQRYVHNNFRGSSSIKKVLPVMVPELSYSDLEIRDGAVASKAWWKIVSDTIEQVEKEKIASDLKTYCGRDTYAMYAIWKKLMESCSDFL